MLLSTTWDYACGKIITTPGQVQWKRKAALITAIVGDMGLLVFFKYYMFTVENINHILAALGLERITFASCRCCSRRAYRFTRSWP